MKKIKILLIVVLLFLGCSYNHKIIQLHKDARNMRSIIVQKWGKGGLDVFNTAVKALEIGYKNGEYKLISIEDLWVEALQEGKILFNKPHNIRWGVTPAKMTGDMLGQTTVGPWQMTIWNIKKNYGPKYGITQKMSNKDIVNWCIKNPIYQARMIADYIENAYEKYGKRNPYAIQSYFWLDAYVKGEIGQSKKWWKSPVAKPPIGKTYKDLTPEMKKDTGFYAKQIVCGTPHQPYGLLFWLAYNDKEKEIAQLLHTWKHAKKLKWDEKLNKPILSSIPANFEITKKDLLFFPKEYAELKKMIEKKIENTK